MTANNKTKGAIIGIPHYTEAGWKIQCQNSVDDSGFNSYEEMLQHTEKLKRDLQVKGCNVVDVPINAKVMHEYFENNGL
ncbi:MAG: hypothetical protein ABH879_04660 [archaeon]